jgi:hypothetical protein
MKMFNKKSFIDIFYGIDVGLHIFFQVIMRYTCSKFRESHTPPSARFRVKSFWRI